jgi:hypothetical protein
MEVLANSDGEYHIKLTIRNKTANFIWSRVSVYGAAQDNFRADFLHELANLATISYSHRGRFQLAEIPQ